MEERAAVGWRGKMRGRENGRSKRKNIKLSLYIATYLGLAHNHSYIYHL